MSSRITSGIHNFAFSHIPCQPEQIEEIKTVPFYITRNQVYMMTKHTDQRGTLTPEDTLTPDQFFMVLTQSDVSIFDFYVIKI